MTAENEIKIAVLEEQGKHMRESVDEIKEVLKAVNTRLGVIEERLNTGKGVFTASLLFAGAIGAGITWLTTWMSR